MDSKKEISLFWHLFIHFVVAILSALFCSYVLKSSYLIGLLAGILGGFLIDIDHVFDYFLVFGLKFNLQDFLKGKHFIISDKIYLLFHAYEYFPLLLLLAYVFKDNNSLSFFLVTLAFSGFIHLLSDSYINNYPIKNYSILYRASLNFSAPQLLNDRQWENNLKMKKDLGL